MAPDTFPKFLQLPKEIQILIWEAAVRPVPGDRHVHRFYIADYRVLKPTPMKPIQGRFLRLLRTKKFEYESVNIATGLSLAVPVDDVVGNPNDSVYLTDSSLWTFCKESRQAMERRFSKNEWWSHVKSPFHPKRTAEPGQYIDQRGAAHTASYQESHGVVKHITIDFDNDLIHLDPRWLSHVDWWHINSSVFQPLFDDSPSHERSGLSFIGSNIAMDYDPSIMDTLKNRRIHYNQTGLGMTRGAFQDMISYLLDVSKLTIWYIDYSLTRAPYNPRASENGRGKRDRNAQNPREIFRSNDCIYTEVKREDIGTAWVVSDSNDEVNSGETENAFDMFDTLSLDGNDLGHFRVLACESVVRRMPRSHTQWARRCVGETCETCYPDKIVPRVPPSTIRRNSESSSDVSSSDLNLFD